MSELAKLRWHCRRGQLELDLLLQDYLVNHYLHASAAEQIRFAELLKLEDDELLAVMLRGWPRRDESA